ncbi:DUF3108 domain-containing protein [Neorhizobium sp. NCHU2750]|uniref:DUF3108 domain-containing protein n=1 Tax=Neorhizobium sp. NCHU2750 TaxID=1825976 RepID=UPI000E756F0E
MFHIIRPLAGIALLLSLSLAASAVPALSADITQVTEYDITLGILPIGTAKFSSEFDGNDYKINGIFQSGGIVNVIKKVSAETNVAGRISGDRLQADRYNLVYKLGKRTRIYDVIYQNGNVTDTTIKPPPRRNPDNWIPVAPGDLKSVLDPLSGLIFPAGAKICSGRVPVYDGESRMDLVLKQEGTKPYETKGFKGEVTVCSVRYEPKSGYRKGRSDIEYLRQTPMEVWFAKGDDATVYAPIYARIPTRMGPLYITAARYGE